MPVIVVGADTHLGRGITDALTARGGEVRAFVTAPSAGARLRAAGVKVAVGDISDPSHLGWAATGCFAAVLIAEAATDARERSFTDDAERVLAGWVRALQEAGVHRVIWVAGDGPDIPAGPGASFPEFAVVATLGRLPGDVVADVTRLEDAAAIG